MFTKKPKVASGFVLKGLPPAEVTEKMVFISIIDETKKKKSNLLSSFLGIEDEKIKESAITLERISRMIRIIENTPSTESINFILHTLGGSSLAVNMLTRAILNHSGTVRVFIPQYAFSAGTMIALAADEIYMTANASLGPIDLQLAGLPLNSMIDSLKSGTEKPPSYLSSFMKSYIDRISSDDDRLIKKLLKNKFGDRYSDEILAKFSLTHHHDYPMDVTELREIGLEIRDLKATWRNIDKFEDCDLIIPEVEVKPKPEADVNSPSSETTEVKSPSPETTDAIEAEVSKESSKVIPKAEDKSKTKSKHRPKIETTISEEIVESAISSEIVESAYAKPK